MLPNSFIDEARKNWLGRHACYEPPFFKKYSHLLELDLLAAIYKMESLHGYCTILLLSG